MPRFYFHLRDGVSPPDLVGTVLANWHEARIEAVRFAGAVIRDNAERIALGEDWRLEMADATNKILFRLDLTSHEDINLSDRSRPRDYWS